MYFKDLFSIKKMEIVTNTQYGQFTVLENDFISRSYISGRHFEDWILPHLLPLIKGDKNVIDIGANLGSHSIPYYKNLTTGYLYAFEPQDRMYHLLVKNLKDNGCERAIAHKVALSFCEGITTLSDNYELHGSTTKITENRDIHNYGGLGFGKNGEIVPAKRLDDFKIENVGFIKIDVEGAERLVLDGAKQTIQRDRPVVFFEHHLNEIFNRKWNEMCETLSVPENLKDSNIFDFFLMEMGYSQIVRVDAHNFLAFP